MSFRNQNPKEGAKVRAATAEAEELYLSGAAGNAWPIVVLTCALVVSGASASFWLSRLGSVSGMRIQTPANADRDIGKSLSPADIRPVSASVKSRTTGPDRPVRSALRTTLSAPSAAPGSRQPADTQTEARRAALAAPSYARFERPRLPNHGGDRAPAALARLAAGEARVRKFSLPQSAQAIGPVVRDLTLQSAQAIGAVVRDLTLQSATQTDSVPPLPAIAPRAVPLPAPPGLIEAPSEEAPAMTLPALPAAAPKPGRAAPAPASTPVRSLTFTDAQAIYRVAPALPSNVRLLLANARTLVDVALTVDVNGNVSNAQITRLEGPAARLLAPEVLMAARQFRFKPARENNRDIPSTTVLTFRFGR